MAKRAAERQITDRDADEDSGDDVEVGEGFNAAPQQEIAKRQIRGLPGRKSGTASPAAPSSRPGTSGSNGAPSFSFGSSSSGFGAASSAKPSTGFTGFSFTPPASNEVSTPPPNASAPAPAPPAQNDRPEMAKSNTKPKSWTPTLAQEKAQVEYYTNLRALNLAAWKPLKEMDVFADLTEALEQILKNYKEERRKIRQQHDENMAQLNGKRSTAGPTGASPGAAGSPVSLPVTASAPLSSSSYIQSSNPSVNSATVTPATAPFAGFASGKTPSFTAADISKTSTPSAPSASFSFASPAQSSTSKSAPEPAKVAPPAPPAPPAAFTFAGSSFKPDASKAATSSSSLSSGPPKGGFVFNASAAASSGEEKSKFALPSTTTAGNNRQSPPAPQGSTSSSGKSASPETSKPASKASENGFSGLSGNASAFMPAGNSRARQPSPLRQVETVPEPAAEKKAVASTGPPKAFGGFSFGNTPGTSTGASPPKSISFGSGTSPKASTGGFTFGAASGNGSSAPASSPKPFSTGFSFGSAMTPSAPAPSNNSATPSFSMFGPNPSTSATTGSPAPSFSSGTSLFPGVYSGQNSSSGFGSNGGGFGGGSNSSTGFGSGPPGLFGGGFGGGSNSSTGFGNGSPGLFGSGYAAGRAPPRDSTDSSGWFSAAPASTEPGAASSSAAAEGASSAPSSSAVAGTEANEGEEAPPEPSENSLLTGGAGEEGEDTLHEARAKLWRNESVPGSEEKQMVAHGVSIVKLKKNADGKVRLLARSDANGRVQMNFSLFVSMKITLEQAFLTFMGFEGQEPMLFRLRLKKPEMAKELKDAIDAEVAKL